MRGLLLAAELAEARAGTAPPLRAPHPGRAQPPRPRRDADSELSSAIVLGGSPQVDLLLRLALRHGISLELSPPLQQRLRHSSATGSTTSIRYDPRAWARREEVLDAAYDELHDRLTRFGARSTFGALQRLHPYLIDRLGDASDPLDRHLGVAAITALPPKDRAARRPGAGPADPQVGDTGRRTG